VPQCWVQGGGGGDSTGGCTLTSRVARGPFPLTSKSRTASGPKDVLIVIDSSGSMSGGRIEMAISAAKKVATR
jgi:Mg-chelatase subunit ChlD